ncbi:MAG: hypothetical protein H0V96_01445 [Acidimicrobiia bacterium]|nr:hypothetical protein [Acidimicrobiia bacterium]
MEETRHRVELWFVHRGVPQFITDYSATEDIWTRTLPFLTVVFLFNMLAAFNSDWPLLANALAVAGGLVLLVAVWGAVNRLRGRPFLARPHRLGAVELSVFVLAAPVIDLVFGATAGTALRVIAQNLLFVGVAFAVTTYGLIPLTRWAAVQSAQGLIRVVGLFARALPLLLLFVLFLFVSADTWQMLAGLSNGYLAAAVALLIVLGGVFIFTQIPREVRQVESLPTGSELVALCAGTPVEDLATAANSGRPPPPLSRRERVNLALVMLFNHGFQVVLVSGLVGAFFVAFGMIAMRPETIELWIGAPAAVVGRVTLLDHSLIVSEQLIRVAVFLAAFSGLYFTVTAMMDPTYRSDFFDGFVGDVRQALAVRAIYRNTLGEGMPMPSVAPAGQPPKTASGARPG